MTADIWADLRATIAPDHPDLNAPMPDNTAHEHAAEERKWRRQHDAARSLSDWRADVEEKREDARWGE